MGTSYEKRKAERDAIARAFIAELRANGYDDDAIVKALIQHNLVELDLSDGIAKALGTRQRYGYPVGPALTLAAEEVAKGNSKPIPHRMDRIKKLREAGEDVKPGDSITDVNRQVQTSVADNPLQSLDKSWTRPYLGDRSSVSVLCSQ